MKVVLNGGSNCILEHRVPRSNCTFNLRWQPAWGGGGKKTYYLTGKKRFAKEKVVFPWTLLTVQFEVYIFSFKEKGAIASYTLRNVIQSFLFILRKSSEKPESYF